MGTLSERVEVDVKEPICADCRDYMQLFLVAPLFIGNDPHQRLFFKCENCE